MTRKEEIEKYARECAGNQIHCVEIDVSHACEWADKTMIDKACEWLKENKNHPLIGCEDPCLSGYLTDEFILDFKKEMEE